MNMHITILATAVAMLLLPPHSEAQQVDPALIGLGARVYSETCARCHNARSGTERTDAEWVVIVGHMRARANMPKTRADAVLAFLQATNLPEGGVPTAQPVQSLNTLTPEELARLIDEAVARRLAELRGGGPIR